jgi:signal transduction histidine kinase
MGDHVVQLNDYIIDSIEALRKTLGARVTLCTSLMPRLPPIQVDPNLIRQAIVDIAAHARDAMSHGGRFMIETRCVFHEHDPDIRRAYVQLSLSHTAPRASLPNLLTIHGFVKQSGGNITTETEVGSGTTINFFLPQACIRLPA